MRVAVHVLFVSVFLFTAGTCPAQDRSEAYRNQAFSKIEVATRLVTEARSLLVTGADKNNVMAAMRLYAQAGRLFEEAGNILKALGPGYARQEDVEGCEEAVQQCLQAIQECRKHL